MSIVENIQTSGGVFVDLKKTFDFVDHNTT